MLISLCYSPNMLVVCKAQDCKRKTRTIYHAPLLFEETVMSFWLLDYPVPNTCGGMGKEVRRQASESESSLCWLTLPCPFSPLNQLFTSWPFHTLHTSRIAPVFKHAPYAKNDHMKMTQRCLWNLDVYQSIWCLVFGYFPLAFILAGASSL